jgi:hypothetical protein
MTLVDIRMLRSAPVNDAMTPRGATARVTETVADDLVDRLKWAERVQTAEAGTAKAVTAKAETAKPATRAEAKPARAAAKSDG